MNTHSGKCLCGALSYVATGAPVVVAQCHCEECRRLSGTGHSIGAMFPESAVSLFGDVCTYTYTSARSAQVTRAFCPACGSPVYGKNTHNTGHLTLTLGSMDEAKGLAVEVIVFKRDQPHWDALDDSVMTFDTQPDWRPPT